MSDADKDFTVAMKGVDRGLGAQTRKAKQEINELHQASKELASAFTGGLIGGGLGSTISKGIDIVVESMRELGMQMQEVLKTSRELQISPFAAWKINQQDIGLGLKPGTTAGYAEAIERSVQQALVDPRLREKFANLGITNLAALAGHPQESLAAVQAAAGRGEMTPGRMFALSGIVGGEANATQMIRTGDQSPFMNRLLGALPTAVSGSKLAALFQFVTGIGDSATVSAIAQAREKHFHPPSTLVEDLKEQARRMEQSNEIFDRMQDLRDIKKPRERIAATRAYIDELTSRANDPEDVFGANPVMAASLLRMTRGLRRLVRSDTEQLNKGGPVPGLAINRQIDSLQGVGIYVGGKPQSLIVLENQLTELKNAVSELREIHSEVKEANE